MLDLIGLSIREILTRVRMHFDHSQLRWKIASICEPIFFGCI